VLVSDLTKIVEQELENAVEVKDRKALHRYAVLVTQGVMQRQEATDRFVKLENDVQSIAQTMREGFASMEKRFEAVDKRFDDLIHQMDKRFEAVDKRFEAVDKRFDDVNKRFEDVNKRFVMVFAFLSIGFTALTVATVLFRFWS
jgi:predicted  nucleic acid-binding Zn-ribbon protein